MGEAKRWAKAGQPADGIHVNDATFFFDAIPGLMPNAHRDLSSTPKGLGNNRVAIAGPVQGRDKRHMKFPSDHLREVGATGKVLREYGESVTHFDLRLLARSGSITSYVLELVFENEELAAAAESLWNSIARGGPSPQITSVQDFAAALTQIVERHSPAEGKAPRDTNVQSVASAPGGQPVEVAPVSSTRAGVMNNPYLNLVLAVQRKDFYIMTQVGSDGALGVAPEWDRWGQLDRDFRQRVQRTLICPNFDLGGLFSADESAGTLSAEETDNLQNTMYEALADGTLKMPHPVTAWVHRAPNRGMTTVAFLEQTERGIVGHAFMRRPELINKWLLVPLTQTNGIIVESHLDRFRLKDEDSVIYVDMPVHWGLYGAALAQAPQVSLIDETRRDRDVAIANTRAKGKHPPIPHPRIISVDPVQFQRVIMKRFSKGGTHASPVPHVRRGHWRSKPGGGGKLWIRETFVNEKLITEDGIALPSYKIVRAASGPAANDPTPWGNKS